MVAPTLIKCCPWRKTTLNHRGDNHVKKATGVLLENLETLPFFGFLRLSGDLAPIFFECLRSNRAATAGYTWWTVHVKNLFVLLHPLSYSVFFYLQRPCGNRTRLQLLPPGRPIIGWCARQSELSATGLLHLLLLLYHCHFVCICGSPVAV